MAFGARKQAEQAEHPLFGLAERAVRGVECRPDASNPLPPKPQPPTGLTATPDNGQVVLSWTASTTPPVYYWIEYRVTGGVWKRISVPFTNCCTATLGYLTNFTSYQFRVFSNNIAGDSTTSSNVASATPVPPVPATPTNLTTTSSDGKVQLHWTASTTPNVNYWIEWKQASATTWTARPIRSRRAATSRPVISSTA